MLLSTLPFVDRGDGREEELWSVGLLGIVGLLYVATHAALKRGFLTAVALSNADSNKNKAQALQQGLDFRDSNERVRGKIRRRKQKDLHLPSLRDAFSLDASLRADRRLLKAFSLHT